MFFNTDKHTNGRTRLITILEIYMSKASSILADFPTATTAEGEAQWQTLIAKVVGDKSYADVLCHKSEDGFLIDPAPKPSTFTAAHQKQSGDCLLAAYIDSGSVESANADILTDRAVFPDFCARHNVAKMPDFRPSPNFRAFIDKR